eukprot:CAMPEP_0119016102 /NCGR_PEP_ID=MMETSP1176-20130426/11815_1 /TAXON_ID=265551 /ORGANISM="Synedropsis recta cf, Strain CCMP1620" /LENGTH=143 /DNA_ID=CAMNT_0006969429 /DNA_START=432 /DNA_END=863 /DNA_ORIENTATION=+
MSDEDIAFTNAKKVINVCDNGKPFDEIQDLVVPDAPFDCQADAMKDIETVKGYDEWMAAFGGTTVPGFTVDVHSIGWDAERKVASFFATFNATHTGPGGPVEPTNKTMNTDYAYFVFMNEDAKCFKMQKVWNDGFAMRQVGWA